MLLSIVTTIGCSNSDSDSDDQTTQQSPEITETVTADKTLDLTARTTTQFDIEGRNQDQVKVIFPSGAVLPSQLEASVSDESETAASKITKSVDFQFQLKYAGDLLVGFSVTPDMEFAQPILIKFTSQTLTDSNRYLEYIASASNDQNKEAEENYFLPFFVDGNTYTYIFKHFSDYEFNEREQADIAVRTAYIERVLNKYESVTDKSVGIIPMPGELEHAFSEITMLLAGQLESGETYYRRFSSLLLNYAQAYADKSYQPAAYLDRYCMNVDSKKHLLKLYQHMGLLATMNIDHDIDFVSKALGVYTAAGAEFRSKSLESICFPSFAAAGVGYMDCGLLIADEINLNEFGHPEVDAIKDRVAEVFTAVSWDEYIAVDIDNDGQCADAKSCLKQANELTKKSALFDQQQKDAVRNSYESVVSYCKDDVDDDGNNDDDDDNAGPCSECKRLPPTERKSFSTIIRNAQGKYQPYLDACSIPVEFGGCKGA